MCNYRAYGKTERRGGTVKHRFEALNDEMAVQHLRTVYADLRPDVVVQRLVAMPAGASRREVTLPTI